MTAVAEDQDAYRASFERLAAAHASSHPAWLRERRTAAMARFVEKGLPGPRDQRDWVFQIDKLYLTGKVQEVFFPHFR